MAKGNYQIPFYENGDMARYADVGWAKIIWKDNYKFSCILKYETYERGRSAICFVFTDMHKIRYYMSVSVFDKLLLSEYTIVDRYTPCIEWTFVKQGQNYSIDIA